MNSHFKTGVFLTAALIATALTSGTALAMDDGKVGVWGQDQSVSNGVVSATKVVAEKNGWLVVHRTDEAMKPGPVVGYAPLRKGMNLDVAAILTEEVKRGDMLMLMLHSEDGGSKTGAFEYTLGATEDGPIRVDGKLVMATITAE